MYHVIDLRQIIQELSDHYRPTERSGYEGQCRCGEFVDQEVNRRQLCDGVPMCLYCGIPVVWQNSSVWRAIYGSPQDAIKRLDVCTPDDGLGKWLCSAADTQGFANQGELDTWKQSLKHIDADRFKKAVEGWRQSQQKKGWRSSGKAMMGFAINLVRKWTREAKDRSGSGKKTIEVVSW